MTTPTQLDQLTLTEYARLYEQDGAFEIIDGERKPLMPPVALHVWTVRTLFLLLYQHCTQHKLGEVFSESPFVLTYGSDWVKGARVPDVTFFSAEKWNAYIAAEPDWRGKPFVLIPDLVVEVVSPNDLYTDIQNKVAHYLTDGVALIWVVDPNRKQVAVYSGKQFEQLGENDTLTGGDVIADLEIELKSVFSGE